MTIEELKKAIVEESEQCSNKDLLLDVLLKFYSQTENSFVQEEGAFYKNGKVSSVPESHYKLLQEDWEKYKSGEIKATPWKCFENELMNGLEL